MNTYKFTNDDLLGVTITVQAPNEELACARFHNLMATTPWLEIDVSESWEIEVAK